MLHGRITRIEPGHGFGFILDDSGLDWFFVRDAVRTPLFDHLQPGARVTFGHEWTRWGPRAVSIHADELD